METNKTKVKKDGKLLYYLNPFLIKQQNLLDDDLEKVINLHNKIHDLFDEIEECSDVSKYHNYAALLENLEYELQDAWKFERDSSKHCWWYKIPHCKCPKLDNRDRWGINERVISEFCPVHSNNIKK